jgi:hypothetical protein
MVRVALISQRKVTAEREDNTRAGVARAEQAMARRRKQTA